MCNQNDLMLMLIILILKSYYMYFSLSCGLAWGFGFGVWGIGPGVWGLWSGICIELRKSFCYCRGLRTQGRAWEYRHESTICLITHTHKYELIRIIHRVTQLFTHSHLAIHLNKLWNIQTPLRRDFHFNASFFLFFLLCALLSPQSEPASICHKCNEVIQQRIITALGKTWHPEHFACKDCQKPITEATFNIQNGEPVCSDCFVRNYSGTCFGCKQPILEVSNVYRVLQMRKRSLQVSNIQWMTFDIVDIAVVVCLP